MSDSSANVMQCLRCRGRLEPSGSEPHRHVCSNCGQNYFLVLRLVPVDPLRPPMLPEGKDSAI